MFRINKRLWDFIHGKRERASDRDHSFNRQIVSPEYADKPITLAEHNAYCRRVYIGFSTILFGGHYQEGCIRLIKDRRRASCWCGVLFTLYIARCDLLAWYCDSLRMIPCGETSFAVAETGWGRTQTHKYNVGNMRATCLIFGYLHPPTCGECNLIFKWTWCTWSSSTAL